MFRESALEERTFKLKVVPELARHLSNKELGGRISESEKTAWGRL